MIFIDEENDTYMIIGNQCQVLIVQADSLAKNPQKHQIICQLSQVSLRLYQVIDLIQKNKIIYVYDRSRMVPNYYFLFFFGAPAQDKFCCSRRDNYLLSPPVFLNKIVNFLF